MSMTQAENPRARIGGNSPPTREEAMKGKYPDLWKRATAWFKKAKTANMSPVTIADCQALDKIFLDGRDIVNDAIAFHKVEKEPFLVAGKEVDKIFFSIRDSLNPLVTSAKDAAAHRRLIITREEQRKADEKAEAARQEANRLAEKAASEEAAGKVRVADAVQAKAEAIEHDAERHEAFAAADVRDASKAVSATGIKSSVGAKLVCSAINRAELDLEALRPFLPEADLIKAVDKYLSMGNRTLKGAVISEKAIGSVRR